MQQLQTDKESIRIKMLDLEKKLEDSKKGAVTTQTL